MLSEDIQCLVHSNVLAVVEHFGSGRFKQLGLNVKLVIINSDKENGTLLYKYLLEIELLVLVYSGTFKL